MGLHDVYAKYGIPMDWDDYNRRCAEQFEKLAEQFKEDERRQECECRGAIKHFDGTGRMLKCESCGRVNVFEE